MSSADSRQELQHSVSQRTASLPDRRLVHAIQDSRTIFILMASFSSAPRPLDPVEEEEPPMPAIVCKIYPPRPFAPEYRAPFPEDITPYDQSPTEQGHWKAYLQETKDAGVDVGSQKAPIQSYIDVSSFPVRGLTAGTLRFARRHLHRSQADGKVGIVAGGLAQTASL